jgi:hypothetical protein
MSGDLISIESDSGGAARFVPGEFLYLIDDFSRKRKKIDVPLWGSQMYVRLEFLFQIQVQSSVTYVS